MAQNELNKKQPVTTKGIRRSSKWAERKAEGVIDSAIHPSRMKLLRLARKLAQGEVAEVLDLVTSTYAQIERSKRPVDKSRAEKIANYFNKPVDFLFDKEKQKNKFYAIRIDALTLKKLERK